MFLSFWPWVVIALGLAALIVLAVRSARLRTLLLVVKFGGDLSVPLHALNLNVDSSKLNAPQRAALVADIARRQEVLHTYVRIGISLLIILSALFVVLSQSYGDAEQKWAFGSIGTVLGYWLKK